ncbi:hypothetical protein [Nannocystis pusilla]|uniref:SPOR domain-containing protein n=1 Tax=Nannocystis pusilla TaxID=889268 RepID=A0ABS7U1C2_9BACT|nr:hypothetical protein [Nannocystis pusilla]MBZ5714221.1 hypothetical protein [Nannocystis pusilla]
MSRAWLFHLGAWLLGCMVAVALAPVLRGFLSPWRVIGPDKIAMFSSDACKTSRSALEHVRGDPRLAAFIVPVPANGPDAEAPIVCAAALEILAVESWGVRWLPAALACRWLKEDAFAVVPEQGVPTPSWYVAGRFVDGARSADEAAVFAARGWRIEWTYRGLRLSRLDAPPPPEEPAPPIRRIEDLGLSSYRDDRW